MLLQTAFYLWLIGWCTTIVCFAHYFRAIIPASGGLVVSLLPFSPSSLVKSNTISWSGGGSVGSGLVRNGLALLEGERREAGLDARLECCGQAWKTIRIKNIKGSGCKTRVLWASLEDNQNEKYQQLWI